MEGELEAVVQRTGSAIHRVVIFAPLVKMLEKQYEYKWSQ